MTSSRGRSSSKHLHASRYTSLIVGASKHPSKHLAKSTKSSSKDLDSARHKRLDTGRHKGFDTVRHQSRQTSNSARVLVRSSPRHRSSANSRRHKHSSSQHYCQQQPLSSSERHKARNIYYYNSGVSKVRSYSKSREAAPSGTTTTPASPLPRSNHQSHQRSYSGLNPVRISGSTDKPHKQFGSATTNSMSDKYGGGLPQESRTHQQSSASSSATPLSNNANNCNKNGRVPQPSDEDKHRALSYKATGNECYKRSFYEAAVENYSLAIKYDPTEPTYRTNRALAYMKQEKWADLTADSESAIKLNPVFFKAHYLLGIGLQMTGRLDEATEKLKQAQRLAPEKKHSLDCDRAIRGAKKKKWELSAEQKRKDLEKLQQILSASSSAPLDEKSRTQLSELVQDAVTKLQPKPIPDYFCCHISMCLLTDPATTPSGLTYERELLLKHIQRNGPFDPLTRETCNANDVRSCVCIQRAIEDFLDENPGSAEDACR